MPNEKKGRTKSKRSIKTWLILCFGLVIIFVIVAQSVFNLVFLEPLFIYRGRVYIEKSFYTVKESYDGGDDFSVLNELAIDLENKYGIKLTLMTEDGSLYSSEYTNFELEQKYGGLQRGRDENSDGETAGSAESQDAASKPQLPESENTENTPGENLPDESTPDEKAPDENESPKNTPGAFLDFNSSDFTEEPNIEITEQARDGRSIVLKGKFTSADKDVYVMMSISLESIAYTVTIFTQVSTAILAFALAIAVLISVFLSRWLARRVVEVESVAKKISELDFDCRADETVPSKELASLACSINSMSGSLRQAIEDLRVANEALKKDLDYQKRLEKMRSEFIANVSHEMKTPLGLLQIYSENLKNNVENIDKDYYCDIIIKETGNLNEMVMSMLDISSIENGLSKMNFEETDLSALCLETANKFAPMFESFALSQSIEGGVFVKADKKYIEQAMKNYISNALIHTPRGGKIELSLKKDGKNAVFTVKNEGKNISEEDITHIWGAFYKSDKARTRTPGNNVGLGLYIVKTVLEKHQGEYGVSNTENGVAFYFTLPLSNMD